MYVPILIVLILLAPAAAAQTTNRFADYGTDEGLPQSTVWNVICDNDGFLWVGTSDGLARFDGYNFKVYKKIPGDRYSIASNREHKFYVDKTGRLWVVSHSGISLYNSAKDNFANIITYNDPYIIAENCIYGEDSASIWAGLCGYGLVKINKQTLQSTVARLPPTDDMADNYASFKGFINNGTLWVCRYNHFFKYNIAQNSVQIMPVPCLNIINMNDSEAFGITHETGLLLNKRTLAMRKIKVGDGANKLDITYLCRIDGTNAILCSSTRGLLFLNTHDGKITKQISEAGKPGEKKPLYARCVYKDGSGNLWIGTTGDGLKKLAAPFKNFKLYTVSPGDGARSLYAHGDTLCVGCYGSGLDVFSRSGGLIKNISVKNATGSLLNNVYAAAPFGAGKLIMMGGSAIENHNNLLFSYHEPTGRLHILNENNEYGLPGYWYKVVNQQFLTPWHDSSLLTGINEYLVSLKSKTGGGMDAKILNCFKNEALESCFWHAGVLYAGTSKGAWMLYKNGWIHAALPGNTEVKTINADDNGNIWYGTPNGIFVADGNNKVIRRLTEQNGLANGHIYGILKDDDGNMWFSHNKGLSVYRAKQQMFEHYTKNDGLQADEFNAGAYFKATDGELFFGGIKGVTSFRPGDIADNPHAPTAKITGIKLFDEPYRSDTSYWNIHSLTLRYDENSLSFDFTALEFTDPLKNRFSYIMQRLDKNWIDAGDKRFARYPGLQPGNYTFMAKAANGDGVWGKPVSIYIYIAPPFWQRAWFRVCYILTFVGATVYIVTYLQKRRFRKQLAELALQQKIQLERERISRDLHDNVGTQLSLISKNIEDGLYPLKTITDEEMYKKFQSARQRSAEVIDTLRETIWTLSKNEITLEEFADQLKNFIHKQLEACDAIDVKFCDHEDNKKTMLRPMEVLNLFRICQEAVANTIKYANATALVISVFVKSGKFCISIVDDGKGFDPAATGNKNHYGLQNMQYRANEIDCTLLINTQQGVGTSITLCKK